MLDAARIFTQRFNLNIGNFKISPSYVEAGVIIFLLFLLVLSFAQLRRHFINWSFKGALFGIFWGFVLALILEGFLILGGRTIITEILGWKNAPKPLVNILDAGRQKLTEVLGVKSQIPSSFAIGSVNTQDILKGIRSLNPKEFEKVKAIICKP